MYTYQWPGTYFLFEYQGPAAYFKVGKGKQDLHISVDGKTTALITDGQPAGFRISTPSGGPHVVRIDSVNESASAPESLGSFALALGGKRIDAPLGVRQMEFIGDSHTVGYGNESPDRKCTSNELFARTDSSHSLGAETALHYGANYEIHAISGHGVVRNYDGGTGDPVPVAYPYLLLDKQQRYEDEDWHPQVVAVSLGTNDFSTALHPTEPWKTRDNLHADFENTYVNFVTDLRKRYPKALIILWSTDGINGEIASEVMKIAQTLHSSGDTRVDFVEVDGLAMSACDYHPSAADDVLISKKLINDIDKHQDVWPDQDQAAHEAYAPATRATLVNKSGSTAVSVTAGSARLAITWDDLPAHGELPAGLTRLELTEEILRAMKAEHVPPTYGFINGIQTKWEPQSDGVFRAWLNSGNLLGNHTWAHSNLNDESIASFEQDIDKNEPLLAEEMGNKEWHWFRYPFLSEGNSPQQRKTIRDYLASKGYKIAAVTVGFPDYDWDGPYVRCMAKHDDYAITKLEDAYLKAARDSAIYSRKLATLLYGRDIPYVLLLHIGPLDAKLLPRTLAQYRAMNFTFVSLEQAESDPFYAADVQPSLPGTSDSFAGRMSQRGLEVPPAPIYPKLDQVCK